MNRIDQQRLTSLRLARGLPVRQLARDCGIEIAVLNRLETSADPSLSMLSVGALARLADYLGVAVGDLFTDDSGASETEAPTDDAGMLGALLTALGQDTAVAAIADALGWNVFRVHDAAKILTKHLRPLGITVFKNAGLISLRPADDRHADAELTVRRHPRAKPGQRLVTPARARLLYRAARKPISPASLTRAERINIAKLIKAGALVEDDQRHFVPSPDVLTSMNPTDVHGAKAEAH